MKNKSLLGVCILLLGMSSFIVSCQDMMTPDMTRYAKNFTGKDTVNFYLGILKDVQNVAEQNVLLGDLRGDLSAMTDYSSDSISDIANFKPVADGENRLLNRSAYYKVINQCNFYLNRVDTMASKNNVFYMRKEAAQVLLIRAWTYMQLVQNYGRVPFITKPVDNADTGWEKHPEAWATPDNLLTLLKGDADRALMYQKAYGYPSYGDFNTGKSGLRINHKNLLFPAELVLGDLYLLSARTKADYQMAAKYYYDYLNLSSTANVRSSSMINYKKTSDATGDIYTPIALSWVSTFGQLGIKDRITLVPSAANQVFGSMLTEIPNVLGFKIKSSNSTTETGGGTNGSGASGDANANGGGAVTNGEITIIPTENLRQVQPSMHFEALGKAQHAFFPQEDASTHKVTGLTYIPNGDARIYASAPEVRLTTGSRSRLPFIQKFGPSSVPQVDNLNPNTFSFNYVIGIYRLRQVFLRFAEALNRAGFPQTAYAVLHGGIRYDKIPKLKDSVVVNDLAKTLTKVYYADSIADGSNFISLDELRRLKSSPFDFSQSHWNNVGILDLGCGPFTALDSLNDYAKIVAEKIANDAKRRAVTNPETPEDNSDKAPAAKKIKSVILKEDIDRSGYAMIDAPAKDADPREIDAVESLISDVSGLETAFEGYRYYDLMRIARHKNNDMLYGANNGSAWMAWQIARRNEKLGLYEQPGMFDHSIFNYLLTPSNWYLQNPKY